MTQLPLFEPDPPEAPAPRPARVGGSGSPEFDRLREFLLADRSARNEVRDALFALTEQVNVTDRGSRFVAGGTVEWIVASAAYAAGVVAIPEGHNADGFDLAGIQAAVQGLFSVKSSFSPTAGEFRITNGINGAGRGFVEPTIFVHQRLRGFVFADPDRHVELVAEVRVKPDAVVLPVRAIQAHAELHPECRIDLEVPYNQGRGGYDPALEFARQLITRGNFPILRRMFEDVARAVSSPVEQIEKLRRLRDDGTLTPEQFTRAVDKLLAG